MKHKTLKNGILIFRSVEYAVDRDGVLSPTPSEEHAAALVAKGFCEGGVAAAKPPAVKKKTSKKKTSKKKSDD